MITDLKKITINLELTIQEVMKVIDDGAMQIALVIDDNGILVGTVTDGDVRRGILKGMSLDEPVSMILNIYPTTVSDVAQAQKIMRDKGLSQMPIVDADCRLVGLVLRESIKKIKQHTTPVFLMAGGLGSRLRPLTENTPKPMIQVGGKPLLEQIILRFKTQGFSNFMVSLNFCGDQIRDYFGSGEKIGAKIDYIEETKRMGTAGALSLIKDHPHEPMIVMNGDILTTTSFEQVLDFHMRSGSAVTICARDYNIQVPYGVLNTDGDVLVSIEEKPVHKHLINAGIYVLSPSVFDYINDDEQLDMPDLIKTVKNNEHKVSVLALKEYWIDIGRIEDLELARVQYESVFNK